MFFLVLFQFFRGGNDDSTPLGSPMRRTDAAPMVPEQTGLVLTILIFVTIRPAFGNAWSHGSPWLTVTERDTPLPTFKIDRNRCSRYTLPGIYLKIATTLTTPEQRGYMRLQEKITSELKVAMKAKDSARTGTIRILIGEFQRQPEKELSDETVVGIIKKLIKSEREVIAAGGQGDQDYIAVLESYLPSQASEEEIRQWIRQNVDLSAFANTMQAMKPIMAHFGSNADGNTVKKILQSL